MDEHMRSPQETLAAYAQGPARLQDALAGLPEGGLDLALSSDSWSIREIVHHVADGDDIWTAFIKRALGDLGGEFSLGWYWAAPQQEWAGRWAYRERRIEPSLDLLRAGRLHTVELLEHVPEWWAKSLRIRWSDGEEEDISVGWVVEMQVQHVEGHIEDICRIREAHGESVGAIP